MDYAGTQIPHIKRMPPQPEFAPLSSLRSQTEECSNGISADHTTTEVYETNVGIDEVGGGKLSMKEKVPPTSSTPSWATPGSVKRTAYESDPGAE
ncbi:MAG: hypothetical protein JOY55_10555 [Mycobacterium sp.]|nr:hypothetical protein [Mycobacterium sp.]